MKLPADPAAVENGTSFFRETAESVGFEPLDLAPVPPQPIDWDTSSLGDPESELPEGALQLDADIPAPPALWDEPADGGEFSAAAVLTLEPPPLAVPDSIESHPGALRMTADSIAFYWPWHSGGDEHWGIYFRVKRMWSFIEAIGTWWIGQDPEGRLPSLVLDQILEHQMEHFRQEKAASLLEAALDRPVYLEGIRLADDPANTRVLSRSVSGIGDETRVPRIPELIATAREVVWAMERQDEPGAPNGYAAAILMSRKMGPPGYRDFECCLTGEQRTRARSEFFGLLDGNGPSPVTPDEADALFGEEAEGGVPVRFVLD